MFEILLETLLDKIFARFSAVVSDNLKQLVKQLEPEDYYINHVDVSECAETRVSVRFQQIVCVCNMTSVLCSINSFRPNP